jgi:hypothetical protein
MPDSSFAEHTKPAESRLQPDQLHPSVVLPAFGRVVLGRRPGVTQALERDPRRIDLAAGAVTLVLQNQLRNGKHLRGAGLVQVKR